MGKVHLELLPSLAEMLGIEGKREKAYTEQEMEGGNSVGELLNQLSVRYRRFGEIVFDTNDQKLTGRVTIFFNGRSLELANGLETRIKEGDTLTLVPFIEGG